MKKLLMVCAIVLLFGVGNALAQPTYRAAEAGTKNFVSEITSDVPTQISLDIYLSNVSEPQQAGGVWIDFSASTANLSYVSAGRAVTDGSEGVTGPWLPGIGSLVNEPLGPGTMIIQVANLGGAAPDGDGDLIVANLTLQYNAEGDATLPLDVTDLISIWTPISDADVVPGSVLIQPGTPVCVPEQCDDGLFCNGTETCVGDVCTPGTAPDCDDGVGCTDDICDTGLDACVNTPNDGTCDDGLFCNGVETCDAVSGCLDGTPPDCNDDVVCTVDTCDETGDSCVNTPDDLVCDDGDACNGDEFCDPASDCQPGTPLDCDDGDLCTTDGCDSATGCVNTPVDCGELICDPETGECVPIPCIEDLDCDDGIFCNGAEICDTGTGNCQSGTPPTCDDGVVCTADMCDTGLDACVNTPDDGACDDGDVCNGAETCDPELDCQAGEPLICEDGDLCTTDGCDPVAGCIYTPVECPVGESCDPASGQCVPDGGVCDPALCDDELFCNGTETCVGDVCTPGTPPDCDDGVGCTDDICDTGLDACVNTPDDGACDDADVCNGTETCDAIDGCQSGTPLVCEDGDLCTTDSCDPATGCVYPPVECPVGESCDPADGQCVPAGCDPPDCDDGNSCTEDVCNVDTCVNTPNDALCDDGNFCNGMETCDAASGCQPGTPVDCDDGVGCTDDACDEAIDACVNDPNDANCPDDGLFCNGDEFCDPVNDCSSTGDPCPEGTTCDEVNDICEPDDEEKIVSVDIKPGSCPNAFNVRSNGVLPVAILGTDEFDVTTIDPDSIRLTREGIGNEVLPRIDQSSYRDAGSPFEGEPCDCHKGMRDGYMDLNLKFTSQDVANGLELKGIRKWQVMVPVTIVGETYDGTPIKGTDCLMLINSPKNK